MKSGASAALGGMTTTVASTQRIELRGASGAKAARDESIRKPRQGANKGSSPGGGHLWASHYFQATSSLTCLSESGLKRMLLP